MKTFWDCWKKRLIVISLALAVIGTIGSGVYRGYSIATEYTSNIIKTQVATEIQIFTSRLSSIEASQSAQTKEIGNLKGEIAENNKLVRELILAITLRDG